MRTILLIVLCLGLYGCATMPPQEEVARLDYGSPLTIDYQQTIKNYFNEVLLDPYSAVYEFSTPYLGYYKDPWYAGKGLYAGQIVEITVNAKNRMGGYTGKKPYTFIFLNNQIIKVIAPPE